MDRTDGLLAIIAVLLALILLEISGDKSLTSLFALLVLAALSLYAIGHAFNAVFEAVLPEPKDES